ncbi:MAG: patatin-like phospholipase family protein [Paracoccaceae bacterium]|nr:patatin-like phospholipase family protein [Paracoccaceae bacterium]
MILSGCTTVLARKSVPAEFAGDLQQVAPYGIDRGLVRFWGDDLTTSDVEAVLQDSRERLRVDPAVLPEFQKIDHADWLILSGGGPDGAYGAGLLAGWSERGDRPDFRLVTGVSTGAIVALFAFLGPQYDDTLKTLYTSHTTDDIASRTIFSGLTGGTALLDTRGYRTLIDGYVSDAMVAELADKHRRGYTLLIGTTNLDASRPVIWNISAIAASEHPMAKVLIRDVIQASSAIPVAFPPVLIPAFVGGERYDEMHVDGGATQQLMLFSPKLSLRALDEALGRDINRTVYIVINNKLKKPYNPIRPRISSIAGAAVSSLISGSGTGDIYKVYAIAARDGEDVRINWIPRDFDVESAELFDPVYMTALYELGFAAGRSGIDWRNHPPDFLPE